MLAGYLRQQERCEALLKAYGARPECSEEENIQRFFSQNPEAEVVEWCSSDEQYQNDHFETTCDGEESGCSAAETINGDVDIESSADRAKMCPIPFNEDALQESLQRLMQFHARKNEADSNYCTHCV